MPQSLYLSWFRRVAFHKRYGIFHKRYGIFHKRYGIFHKRYGNYRGFFRMERYGYPLSFPKVRLFHKRYGKIEILSPLRSESLSHQERKEEALLKPPLCP